MLLVFCYVFYVPIYWFFAGALSDQGRLIYLGGYFIPLLLAGAWRIFEAMQEGGEFCTYYKVMGRFYLQAFSICALPVGIAMNSSVLTIPILVASVLAPTIIWFFMYGFVNAGMQWTDPQGYRETRARGEDCWTEDNDLDY